MKSIYNTQYPSVADLRKRAKRRIPKFAFDYLEGGCNDELNLRRNERDFHDILLRPQYLEKHEGVGGYAQAYWNSARFISTSSPALS